MSEIVNCEICGRICNKSYLKAHKRLAHQRRLESFSAIRDEVEALEVIASLYARLSEQGKKQCRDRVAKIDVAVHLSSKQ